MDSAFWKTWGAITAIIVICSLIGVIVKISEWIHPTTYIYKLVPLDEYNKHSLEYRDTSVDDHLYLDNGQYKLFVRFTK